ncbi:MAG: DUF5631 domain-containing protein [Mycolicibacter algericus]|uniref:DUF5631 domain-containing protein n=1 Tax=Mycolicibacter algericus TaxID=1288388 RepID=UPI003C78BED8
MSPRPWPAPPTTDQSQRRWAEVVAVRSSVDPTDGRILPVAPTPAVRSGVADNEFGAFRQVVGDTATGVLSAYPEHTSQDVTNWMFTP